MVRLTILLIAAAVTTAANANADDLSRTENLGSGFVAAQKKAAAAADGFAGNLYEPGSAQYTASFRQILNRALPESIRLSAPATQELSRHIAVLRSPASQSHFEAILGGTPVPGSDSNTYGTQSGSAVTIFDNDPRYRANVALLTGSQGADLNRIYGGLPTGGYLNTVVLTGGTALCSGTVISHNAVVTAQHCLCDGVTSNIYVGNVYNDQGPSYRISRGVPMKSCGSPTASEADIALMFVDKDFDASIKPAVLASKNTIDQAKIVRAVGFGLTERNTLGQKMMVDIPVVSAGCAGQVSTTAGDEADSAYYGCNSNFELVAAAPLLNKDTCNGDSGGPVFVRDSAGQDYLAAATSRAIVRPGSPPCGAGGIYVRLDGNMAKWIAAQGVTPIVQH